MVRAAADLADGPRRRVAADGQADPRSRNRGAAGVAPVLTGCSCPVAGGARGGEDPLAVISTTVVDGRQVVD